MRKKGSTTKIDCWGLKVNNCGNCIHEGKYKTLKDMASELGFTYNQMVEMSSGRKKVKNGKFDTTYEIIKMAKKLNEDDETEIETKVDNPMTDETVEGGD